MEEKMVTILWVVLIFGVVIMIHEMGHFLVAKLFGARIDTFSIGFGPKLISKKIGETEYCLSMLPFGGYVRPAGPDFVEDLDPKDPDNSRYLVAKPGWQKLLVFVAGVTFNFLLAIVIITGVFYRAGKVPMATDTIGGVVANSPAAQAGFQKGDRITAVNGVKTGSWQEAIILMADSIENRGADKPIRFEISRNGRTLNLTATPKYIPAEKRYLIGIAPGVVNREIKNLPEAMIFGVREVWSLTALQAKAVWQLATGKLSAKNLGGPIAVIKMTAEAAQGGFASVLSWLFYFNILLGFFNLLPVPPLDGGHVVFSLVQIVRGKPVSKKVQEWFYKIGMLLLIMLILFATLNDFGRLQK